MNLLTRTEEMILLAVYRLGDNAYGTTIRAQIEELLGREFSVGAIYVPLDRLVQKGYLTTYQSDPTPARGGRSKRFYRVTADGLSALREVRALEETMWRDIPELGTISPSFTAT